MKKSTESKPNTVSKYKVPYVKRTYTNLWGCPYLNDPIKEYAQSHDADILMVPTELTSEVLSAKKNKLLIMGFGFLTTMQVPLLTYVDDPSFGWRRRSIPKKWRANSGTILVPTFTRMPDTGKEYIHKVKTATEGQFARLHASEDLMHRVLR